MVDEDEVASASATRLWDKGEALDKAVHTFTVGSDPEIDRALVPWDAIASAAHARMLHKVGIISQADATKLVASLHEIYNLGSTGEFGISSEQEDCHTAIEVYLTEHTGDAGKCIHTGRSRNDQVIVAMRLYLRNAVLTVSKRLSELGVALTQRISSDGDLPFPGFTHMQPAMPANVEMLLHAYIEWTLELLTEASDCLELLDSNPLGAASGFGTPLPLDREYTAELLGFRSVQRSPIAVQNSRGRYELRVTQWFCNCMGLVEKIAGDLLWYSMEAFGFVKLPVEFTTGSSIMPQKRNPDVLELLRARASQVRSSAVELAMLTSKLPSHYHRDFQCTKEPTIRAFVLCEGAIGIVSAVIGGIKFDENKLSSAMTDELYATYEAYREVKLGTPFRDAYVKAAERYKNGELDIDVLKGEFEVVAAESRKEVGVAVSKLSEFSAQLDQERKRLIETFAQVFDV